MSKKVLFTVILTLTAISAIFAQGGGISVGKGKQQAHSKAILELVSDTKGILVPRLTTISRNAMFKDEDLTAVGLMVFDTDENAFFYYNGTTWNPIGSGRIELGETLPAPEARSEGEIYFLTALGKLAVHNGANWVQMGNPSLAEVLLQDNDAGGEKITGLGAPENQDDAATKRYVDDQTLGGMRVPIYDTNINGVVDNAEKVNNFAVEATVPSDADFTDDQSLADVLAQGNNAGTATIVNLGAPTNPGDAATKSYVDGYAQQVSEKNQANGYVGLGIDGKVGAGYLPGITMNSVSVLNSEAAQLSLDPAPGTGDVVIRTDINKTYVHNGGTDGDMNDWYEMLFTDAVTSINNLTGNVNLDAGQVPVTATGNLESTDVQAALEELQSDIDSGVGTGDMQTSVYDTDIDGTVDNAEQVNNFTVESAVPASADFTDNQTLGDVLAEGNSAGNRKITDLDDPENPADAATKQYVDGQTQTLDGVLAEGNSAGNRNITNLAAPVNLTDAATKGYVDGYAQGTTEKNQPNGYAGLNSEGKIAESYLSGITVNAVHVLDNETDHLGLTNPSVGDMVIRSDQNKTYAFKGGDHTVIDDWAEMKVPSSVTSVNSLTGSVELIATSIPSTAYGNLESTNVQTALQELQGDIDAGIEGTLYYGELTEHGNATETNVSGLTSATKGVGVYGNTHTCTGGYFTLAMPSSWRSTPVLAIGTNKTLSVLTPNKEVSIGGTRYVVWQVNIDLTGLNLAFSMY